MPTCGDCYGAKLNDTHCCNTCQDVIDAYREKRWNPNTEKFEQCRRENYVDKDGESKKLALNEGCQIYGHMEVNRVSNFSPNHSITISNSVCFVYIRCRIHLDGRQFPYCAREKFLTEPHSHSRCASVFLIFVQSVACGQTFIFWRSNQFRQHASARRRRNIYQRK